MAHIPVNHNLRPLYRALAGLIGLYILLVGIIGVVETSGESLFKQDDLPWVLGLRTNLAFSILNVVVGAVLLLAAVIGRNLDHFVNIGVGIGLLVAGMAMLALLRTDANFLGFSVVNCIVSFVLGMLLLASGLYGKVGTAEQAKEEEDWRVGAARS